MADARSIKRRIRTSRNIAQITQAMEMVAASKMRRAQDQTTATRPYSSNLYAIVSDLAQRVESGKNKFLSPPKEIINCLLVLIGPDKGLCGGLVSNLSREVFSFEDLENKKISILAIGKKARDITLRSGIDLIADFPIGLSQPKYEIIVPVAKIITDGFLNGNYQEVFVGFTEFINTMTQRPGIRKLLPVEKPISDGNLNDAYKEYLFEPNIDSILNSLIPHYLEMQLYQLLLEAFASEQSARMMAMKNATDNAKDIMQELTLSYNKVRQQIITNEIADIATASLVINQE